MSRKEFSRESVDMIYENAKRISYNQGFLDGYKRGVEDAKEMVGKLKGSIIFQNRIGGGREMIKELANIYQVQVFDNRSPVAEFAGEFSTFREAEAKVKELKSGSDYSENFYRPLFWKIVDVRDGVTMLSGILEGEK